MLKAGGISSSSHDIQKDSLWKTNLADKAAEAYLSRESSQANLQDLIYGKLKANVVSDDEVKEEKINDENSGESDDDDDDFFKLRNKSLVNDNNNNNNDKAIELKSNLMLGEEDSSKLINGKVGKIDIEVWLNDDEGCVLESLRDKFVTGNWADDKDNNEFDGFEDLESGEKFGQDGEANLDSNDQDDDADIRTDGMTDLQLRDFYAEQKASKKETFNVQYDEEKKDDLIDSADSKTDEKAENEYVESIKQEKAIRLKRNQEEFGGDGEASRIRHEGFRQGLYVRVRIDGIPSEFLESFNPIMPLVLGGLTPQETNRGYTRCRFKKHRWHKRILKCNDPLIFSIGWRRFQSIPVYSTEDQNGRHRYCLIYLILLTMFLKRFILCNDFFIQIIYY